VAGDDGLTQDFDAHVFFTFAQIPDAPRLANIQARSARWLTIAFAESWLAVWMYRLKLRLVASETPLLPGALDVISRALFRVQIGKAVRIGPGLTMTHGHVVIDGRTTIGARCQINPWVTIGLSNSRKLGFSVEGPTIGDDVHIGTGAKILGPVHIGDGARIGANAVVISDVPAGATVVGVPARVVGEPKPDGVLRPNATSAIRAAIAGYRTRQTSLRGVVDALMRVTEEHPQLVDTAHHQLREDIVFLDAIAATGGEESRQVDAAIDAIDRAFTE
jgi:serine O-acetyltransferase